MHIQSLEACFFSVSTDCQQHRWKPGNVFPGVYKKTPTSIWPAGNSVSVVMREVIATWKLSRSPAVRGCLDKSLLAEQSPGAHHIHSPKGFNLHRKKRKGKKMANGVYSACRASKNTGEKRENSLTPIWCCLFLTHHKISLQSKERGAKQLYKL